MPGSPSNNALFAIHPKPGSSDRSALKLSECRTFDDFRRLVNDDEDLALARLAFPGALERVSSLCEAIRLLTAAESLEYEYAEVAFKKVMEYITDSETLDEFNCDFPSGWYHWMFRHRELTMLVCEKHDLFG